MQATESMLTVGVDAGVATVEFDRPLRANAIDLAGWHDLGRTFAELSDRADVRAVVLRGRGANFCAGIDLSLLATIGGANGDCEVRASEALQSLIRDLQETVDCIERCRKPVIAAIHGACVGAGVDVACAADIRLCAEQVRFCIKEVDMAVVADLGTIQRLPGIVGAGVARELIFTARVFDGAEAARIGFVNRVLADPTALFDAADAMARTIAAKSPLAVRGTKESLVFSRDRSVAEGLAHVALLNAARLRSADFREAIAAMNERRPPEFRD